MGSKFVLSLDKKYQCKIRKIILIICLKKQEKRTDWIVKHRHPTHEIWYKIMCEYNDLYNKNFV